MRSAEEIAASLVEVRPHPQHVGGETFDVLVAGRLVRNMLSDRGADSVAAQSRCDLLPVVRAVRDIVLREGLAGSPGIEQRLAVARVEVACSVGTSQGLDPAVALTLLRVIDYLSARCAALERMATDETGYAAGRAVGHVEALAAARKTLGGWGPLRRPHSVEADILQSLEALPGNQKDEEALP